MREALTKLDVEKWDSVEKSCKIAFFMYLGIIMERRHPTAPLVAHAFLQGLAFHPLRMGCSWAEPVYTEMEQLWSAANDAFTGIEAFLMQHGIDTAVHDEPSDFQQAPTTSHSTQMLVRATLEECNTTATFQFQLRCQQSCFSSLCLGGGFAFFVQAAMVSVASVQSVSDWNDEIMGKHFDKVRGNTPKEYHPFWMHADIRHHYRLQMRSHTDVNSMFLPGGFRFNPRTRADDTFGVFVQSLGGFFVVIEKDHCKHTKSPTDAIWKISGERVGGLWIPSGKERLTATPFGGASSIWILRLMQEL